MEVSLAKKPKGARIIVGYPGFGLVGTITTGFLIDHLACEHIGSGYFPEMPATVAIHQDKLLHPVDIYFNKKYNVILFHAIAPMNAVEWKAAGMLTSLSKELGVKELITIEGVAGQNASSGNAFYHTNQPALAKKLESAGATKMREGIIMGLSSALLIKNGSPLTCLFAESNPALPDSKAAAKMIAVLDKYLDLDVDYKPLLKEAQAFEEKLKGLLEQRKQVIEAKEKHETNYIS